MRLQTDLVQLAPVASTYPSRERFLAKAQARADARPEGRVADSVDEAKAAFRAAWERRP
jgi:hypothetical protein